MNLTRNLRPLAVLAAAALIGAGCSNGSAEDGDTGSSATAGSSATGTTNATTRSKAARFAQCMRDNGVREFPDPDASGELTADGVLNGSSLDPDGPAWKQAIAACEDLQPPGFTGDENVTDEEQDARLEFAQCIRDNGVKDFPDPARGAPMVDTRRIPSAATSDGMTILNAAMRKCRDLGAEAIGR